MCLEQLLAAVSSEDFVFPDMSSTLDGSRVVTGVRPFSVNWKRTLDVFTDLAMVSLVNKG